LLALSLRQFNPYSRLGHPSLGFFDWRNLARRHAFGNSIGGSSCQIGAGLGQCCALLCRQSLEEGRDHGGANFDAAYVQFFGCNVASSLCRRDTGSALATHFDGQIDLHALCAGLRPLVFQ